ncbi:MAG: hypothetical protein IJ220_09345 [Clostridia bacterium]|nr:hypothetical protein [Clostridia bacterium]
MKKSKEQREHDAIKLKYVFFEKECANCKSLVKHEKMWNVWVHSIVVGRLEHLYFCQDCANSVDEVMHFPRVRGRIYLF